MIKFSKEKVLLLHQLMAEATGGSVGLHDEGLLDSALESAFSGFGDQEFYPTKEEKGARLGFALITNHAFVDGNKRIGVYIMLSFLEMNGIRLQCTDAELVEIGLSIASGKMNYEELLQWVLDHKASLTKA
ncbi:MAG: type II toxin-antitoxin system death-on-curing family toxin [Clostridia bacterium]|nr:type II toxin-antitoxin system death-on-curing family toxin [Clostridia bacterium]